MDTNKGIPPTLDNVEEKNRKEKSLRFISKDKKMKLLYLMKNEGLQDLSSSFKQPAFSVFSFIS